MKRTQPLLRYPGSKYSLAQKIIKFIPRQHDSYIEPFAGGAAVLFQKKRSRLEVLNYKDLR